MVDIHSHILYGLDDGPKEFETSLAMLRMAADGGTTDIVATPHSDLMYPFQPESVGDRIAELSRVEGLPRIHRGCELYLSFDNIHSVFDNPSTYTINGRSYLLVEFHNQTIAGNMGEVLRNMVGMGICPVIAHPERNPLLAKELSQVAEWVESGCRVQVTAQSFTGRFGKSAQHAARDLMRQDLVHFVASDAHDLTNRPPTLRPAFDIVCAEYGAERADAVFRANPAKVLSGESISLRQAPKKGRGWFKLW